MTTLYENMKTEKRRAEVGDTVKHLWNGAKYKVKKVDGEYLIVDYVDGKGSMRAPARGFEVITEHDTITIQEENTKLRTELRKSKDLVESLREDLAASEEYYQQEIARLNGIIDTIQNYVKGLEGGVR